MNQPNKNPDVLSRKSEDVTFLVNTATNGLYRVNKIEGRIWELLDGTRSLDEIAQIIPDEFKKPTLKKFVTHSRNS